MSVFVVVVVYVGYRCTGCTCLLLTRWFVRGFCSSGGSSKEQFVSPFVLPKLPSRVYVRYGEAITLEGLDRRDKDACQAAYERVKVRKTQLCG